MIFGLLHINHSYLHIVHRTNKWQTALDSIIMEEALKQWHLVKPPSPFTFLQYEAHLSPKSEDNLYFTH